MLFSMFFDKHYEMPICLAMLQSDKSQAIYERYSHIILYLANSVIYRSVHILFGSRPLHNVRADRPGCFGLGVEAH